MSVALIHPRGITRRRVLRVAYRYVSGRPLSGRDGYPYLSRGKGRLAGWQRQALRLGVPAAVVVAELYPQEFAAGATVTATGPRSVRQADRNTGVLPWSYEAAKKRLQRKVGKVPTPRGRKGNADAYSRADLTEWVNSS